MSAIVAIAQFANISCPVAALAAAKAKNKLPIIHPIS